MVTWAPADQDPTTRVRFLSLFSIPFSFFIFHFSVMICRQRDPSGCPNLSQPCLLVQKRSLARKRHYLDACGFIFFTCGFASGQSHLKSYACKALGNFEASGYDACALWIDCLLKTEGEGIS